MKPLKKCLQQKKLTLSLDRSVEKRIDARLRKFLQEIRILSLHQFIHHIYSECIGVAVNHTVKGSWFYIVITVQLEKYFTKCFRGITGFNMVSHEFPTALKALCKMQVISLTIKGPPLPMKTMVKFQSSASGFML